MKTDMKTWWLVSLVGLVGVLALAGCDRGDEATVPEVSVEKVASLVEQDAVVPVDANSEDTRQEYGIIPGARLLSSTEFDSSELPSDKSSKLVFYCANTRCSASDKAAERAVEAGYADVSVMRAGIKGWQEAGQPTRPPQS